MFCPQTGGIVEEDEVEGFAPEEGEISGAQGGGEVSVGIDFRKKKPQLLRGERAPFSSGTGEDELLGGGFRAGDHTVSTVIFHSFLQTKFQTAAGQGAGDEDTAVRGVGGEGFGEEEGDPQPGEISREQTGHFDI